MLFVSQRPATRIKLLLLSFVGLLLSLPAQPLPAQTQDSLAVIIQNIATENASLRGYSANYPYPILSFLSILDGENRPVRGLADTLSWLGPNDVANNGQPISKVWQPIFDYESNAPVSTETANLYNHRPQPTFIEICESCTPIVPTTTMLLMDVSGSINRIPNALDSAKAGLKSFIAEMRPEDRAGVIQFNCEIKHLPPTNDQQVLIDFIEAAVTGPWTPLYEAIINALDSIKDESSLRRSIVVYTDGINNLPRNLADCDDINRPLLNEDSVIVAAQKLQIPIYMIALANSTSEEILKKIATETGGRFFKTADGASFTEIYQKVSDIIQNFYVMAHISPQPCESDFTRTVDITVTDSSATIFRTNRDTHNYTVAGPPRLYDLKLTKSANRDSAARGDEIEFALTIENLGPHPAFNISLRDSLSDFLSPLNADGNILSWHFDALPAQQSLQVSYSAVINETAADSTRELSNVANVHADCDSDSANDSARLRVRVFKRQNYDLAIQKSANSNSVSAGENITYTMTVRNLGPNTAFNITVRDTLPDLLTALDGDSVAGNLLFWKIDSLAPAQNINIAYQAAVADPLPISPVELINIARVFADGDTNAANNFASATVIAQNQPPPPPPKNYDLSIEKIVSADSVLAGGNLNYSITVRNLGPNTAFNIAVRDTLPDLLTALAGDSVAGNLLFWKIDSLAPAQNINIAYQAAVADPLPISPVELINIAHVFADGDTNAANNFASARVIGIIPPPPACPDLAVSVTTNKDSIKVGEEFTYTIRVSNLSRLTAYNILVQVTIPEFVTPLDFESRQGNDLFWRRDSLAGGEEIIINFRGRLHRSPPSNFTRLVNTARVTAGCDDDDSNNIAQNFVTVLAVFEDCGVFLLDANVYEPERGRPLGIQFELSESRAVQLDVYDITGVHVTRIAEATFAAGQNRFEWNGVAANGQKVGSGVYVISLRSNNLLCWKKVIIAR